MYMALSTGVVDATITGIDNIVERKIYETIKYGLQLPIFSGMWFVAMNKDTWNSLPKELQALIDEVSPQVAATERKRMIEGEAAMWETVRKAGVTVYTISPEEEARWRKVTAPVGDKFIQEWAAKGYPMKQALEMMRKVARKK
jgi:TRAP-type transport system periplasmic protein